MYKKKPFFIVFEGVEGCGKSYQSKNNLFFAGAWNGYGFHEDGVKSALNIAKKLKVDLNWLDKNEKSN